MSEIKRVEKGLYTCGPVVIENEARMGLPRPEWQVKVNDRPVQWCRNLRHAKAVALRLESTVMAYRS